MTQGSIFCLSKHKHNVIPFVVYRPFKFRLLMNVNYNYPCTSIHIIIVCVYLPENDPLEVSPSSQHQQEIDTLEIDGSKEPPQVHSGTVQVIILAIPLYRPVWSQFIMTESY